MRTEELAIETVARTIHWIRGKKVILDRDLAVLYGVETRVLKQAVRRNGERFPEDFMFVLSPQEFEEWRSQNVMSEAEKKGLRHAPMAFTEQGVAMLSSVLLTLMDGNRELARRIDSLEARYEEQFRIVFDAIRRLLTDDEELKRNRRRAGFHP